MFRRLLAKPLLDAVGDTPVVLVNGARQTGKTTLMRSIVATEHPAAYVTLDDAGALATARGDPTGFIAGFKGSVIIDEIQHAPELFPAIKVSVDNNRVPGRFLLTGSANILLLPRLSESLAGRMEILTLWPLSQSEILGSSENVIDRLFANKFYPLNTPAIDRESMIRMLLVGGYPEAHSRTNESRRRAWFNSYITTILQRDVREMAAIEGLSALPRLLFLLASRSASLLNLADISRAVGIPYATLNRYMILLEATYLVQILPAWSSNIGVRLVKAPKVHLNDTGLISALLSLNAERLMEDGYALGGLLETFVAMELRKAMGASETRASLFHYRTLAGHEVDLLLEDASGRLVGIEVKASATLGSSDFKGLKMLREAAGDRFLRGVILYGGRNVVPFGENLHAVSLSALWRPRGTATAP